MKSNTGTFIAPDASTNNERGRYAWKLLVRCNIKRKKNAANNVAACKEKDKTLIPSEWERISRVSNSLSGVLEFENVAY